MQTFTIICIPSLERNSAFYGFRPQRPKDRPLCHHVYFVSKHGVSGSLYTVGTFEACSGQRQTIFPKGKLIYTAATDNLIKKSKLKGRDREREEDSGSVIST